MHTSGRIYIARSVRFNELEFPYITMFPSESSVSPSHTSSQVYTCPFPTITQRPHPPISTPVQSPIVSSVPLQSTSMSRGPSSPSIQSPTVSQSISPHTSPPIIPISDIHIDLPIPPVPNNIHPMQTRSKHGIFKPKALLSVALHELEPTSFKHAITNSHWQEAMLQEIQALHRNNTWTLVPYSEGMSLITSKWIYKTKYKPDGSIERHKARLVARGFQQTPGVDYKETFSPVIKPCTIRIVFTLAVTRGWTIQQIDINNAFLHGQLQESVYMNQPQGFVDTQFPHHVCKLNKAIYGLRQAPRAWFDKLRSSFLQHGFTNSKTDTSLFFSCKQGKLLLILVYVDDILITGDDSAMIHQLIKDLHFQFALKTLGPVSYFLGLEVFRDATGLYLYQHKYIMDLLERTHMLDSSSQPTPMCPSVKLTVDAGVPLEDSTPYRQVVGALQYLTLTRPDISFAVNKLSQYLKTPTSVHWSACKRVLRYLAGTSTLGLHFRPGSSLALESFADADWAGSLDDRKSTSGYLVFYGGNLVSWSSKKQQVVARSSTESEYRSLALAASEVMWISSLLQELHLSLPRTPVIWCDNLGASSLASNPVFHARTKHIEIDVHFVRDQVLAANLEVSYVESANQVADLLTKPLPIALFSRFASKLQLHNPPCTLKGGIRTSSAVT